MSMPEFDVASPQDREAAKRQGSGSGDREAAMGQS